MAVLQHSITVHSSIIALHLVLSCKLGESLIRVFEYECCLTSDVLDFTFGALMFSCMACFYSVPYFEFLFLDLDCCTK